MAARLLFGLLAQLTGEIGELIQGGIDADKGELGAAVAIAPPKAA